jgi:hypothetical protein
VVLVSGFRARLTALTADSSARERPPDLRVRAETVRRVRPGRDHGHARWSGFFARGSRTPTQRAVAADPANWGGKASRAPKWATQNPVWR